MNSPSLLPEIPSPLIESSAIALEWPRLREHIATRTTSPLGRAWVTGLEPSSDLSWIETQHTRTSELRAILTAGGTFDFNGLFDATSLLDKARIDGAALEALEIVSLLNVAERVAAWRNLFASAEASRTNGLASATSIAALTAPLLNHDLAPLLRALRGKIEPTARSPMTPAPNSAASAALWSASTAPSKSPSANRYAPSQARGIRKTNSSPSAATDSSFPSKPSSAARSPESSTERHPLARPSSLNPSKPSSRTTSSSASSTKNNPRSTAY